jgi:hypothetical protein
MIFQRPFTQVCQSSVSLKLNLELLRQAQQAPDVNEAGETPEGLRLPTWESFAGLLQTELALVLPERKPDLCNVLYSTNAAPETFGNALNEKAFALLKDHDATKAQAQALRAEHEAIEAAKPPPVVVEKRYDENGEELPEKPKSKRQLREEAEQKKKDTERLRKVLETEHRFECLAIKLRNVFQLHSIRVPLL